MVAHSHPQANRPPGSDGLPLIGEIREWLADPLEFARERAERYGPVWRTHLLGRPTVVLLEPEGNKFILSSGMQHFSWRAGWGRSMLRLMGGGLSLTDGQVHDTRRSTLRPAFTHATLQAQVPSIAAAVREACAAWARRGQITLLAELKALAFDIAALIICGPLAAEERHILHADFELFTAGLFTPLPWPIPGTPYWSALWAGRRLRQRLGRLVSTRRRAPIADASDALSLLLAGSEALDDVTIISELLLLIWAGHDTVASLLTWVGYELAQHPEHRERLRQEAADVLGAAEPDAATLRQLPQLDHVLRECERLHPPAPGGFRGVVAPFEYGGYSVPSGWLAMYSTVYTHWMPSLWHAPDLFNPDRFAGSSPEGKTPYSLIGFGGGPRVCIGLALAQIEMRLVVLELVRRYTWQIQPGQDLSRVWLPTNQPRSGLKITLRRLDQAQPTQPPST